MVLVTTAWGFYTSLATPRLLRRGHGVCLLTRLCSRTSQDCFTLSAATGRLTTHFVLLLAPRRLLMVVATRISARPSWPSRISRQIQQVSNSSRMLSRPLKGWAEPRKLRLPRASKKPPLAPRWHYSNSRPKPCLRSTKMPTRPKRRNSSS